MKHEIVVRNNVSETGYTVHMELSPEEAAVVEQVGKKVTEESDWDITMVVYPVNGKADEG